MQGEKGIIYFDNAATSYPKPRSVFEAMEEHFFDIGASPGRSGHRLALAASRIIMGVREELAALLGVNDPLDIVLTKNVTEALNIAAFGLLKAGDNVVTTAMEHNSVIRPLRELEAKGVEVSVVPCSLLGKLDWEAFIGALKPNTKAIFMQHISNVTGGMMPIAEVGKIAQAKGIVFIVDGAQSAGAIPIDLQKSNVDIFAFTGHKSLLGPQGTGGFYIRKGLASKMSHFACGGTGSRSEYEVHPDFLPDKFEAGTPNTIGFAGLLGALRFLAQEGIANIRAHEEELTRVFSAGLEGIEGVSIYGNLDATSKAALVSLNIDGVSPSEAALILDEEFGIMTRVGLHCAPLAHRSIGTFPIGTLRFSFGYFNTLAEIHQGLRAIAEIADRFKRATF